MRELAARAVEIRERFAALLRERGFDPIPSAANFILVPVAQAARVASAMRERGIAVRPYPALRGIGDAVRITMAPWADDGARTRCAGRGAWHRQAGARHAHTGEWSVKVTIFDYGAGNMHSLAKALAVRGADVVIEPDPMTP